MHIFIYNTFFLKRDGSPSVNIGGIETLISYLIPVLIERKLIPIIFQCADLNFTREYEGAIVHGKIFPFGTPTASIVEDFRSSAARQSKDNNYIEIFGAEYFSIPNNNPRAISIQNGIWWDQPIERLTPKKIFHNTYGELIFRLRKQFQMLKLFENCQNRVCADLNYINWYRTCRGSISGKVWYNPNPAPVTPWNITREAVGSELTTRIIFARRFIEAKGTRIISEVFKELLTLRSQIEITLAGDGPETDFLINQFSAESRVKITSYEVKNVIPIHSMHDIAVIPSLLSEATCLSVVEAMASGCAVVATNFGGITNQIIPGYNGLLAWPTKESLLSCLLRLIDNPAERLMIQKRGWEVSQSSFSLKTWREKWGDIIDDVRISMLK